MSDSFAELFEQSQIENKMRPGTIISAKVLDIKNDNVILNAGLKSEGIIPIEQFLNDEGQLEINIGDEVDVSLDSIEDGYGFTRLSREKAKRKIAWQELEKAHEDDKTVIGIINDKSLQMIFHDTPGMIFSKSEISKKKKLKKIFGTHFLFQMLFYIF